MKKRMLTFTRLILLSVTFTITFNTFAAQDAGSVFRRFQEETWQRLAPKVSKKPTEEDKSETPRTLLRDAVKASSERVRVSAFSVHGVTQLSESDVATVLKPFIDKDLNSADIHAAADALNRQYRNLGYFTAKVFVPPQKIGEVIRLDVYEGLLDQKGFEIINNGSRIDSKIVQDILEVEISRNEPMHRSTFERALLIAADLPGITTSSILYPGEQIGTSRLRTTIEDRPLFSGNIDLDNFGSRANGQLRLGTTLYLNSPTRIGDQVVTRLVSTGSSSNYAYLTYLRPISSYGTRMGVSIDHFNYKADFVTNLGNSEGQATDIRFYLTHPVRRSRHGNLNLRADVSQLQIDDSNDLQINAERKIDTFTLTLHGDDDHPWINTGLSVYDASLTLGNLDITGNTAYINADRMTTRTNGSFARMNYRMSRFSRLSEEWALLSKIHGQFASKNLDSSQKFYLGGGTSISGYPVGEASGDSGGEIFLELQRDFHPSENTTLTSGLFYQHGWVQAHKTLWDTWQGSNPNLQNQFSLQSVGLSVSMTLPNNWVARGLIGRQVGDNPMKDPVTGNASDGRDHDYRGWFQIIRYF